MKVCMLVTNRGIDDPRVCMEADALARTGTYDVNVVGWDREIDGDIIQRQGLINFHRLHLRSTHARGPTQLYFLWRFWKRAQNIVKRISPQIVHCHDLDTLPLGARCARRLGAKLVFDAHENFPDMMMGHLPAVMVTVLRRLEKRLVPKADLLITVGQKLANYYEQLGARNVAVVGNWKDAAAYNFPAAEIADVRKQIGLDGTIAVCFIANLGRERHLEPLMRAVAADKRFSCVIGGKGKLQALAQEFASRHDNIHYLGQVPPERVGPLTAACDVVYYGFDKGNPNSRWSAPNKLYEAIAAGKAMLAGDFGEIGQIIRTHRCGILTDTGSSGAIAEALGQLAQPEILKELSQRARQLQEQYSATFAAQCLEKAYAARLGGP